MAHLKPLLRNIAAVLLGIVVGSVNNMCLAYLPMAWLGSRRALVVKDGALL
jgi:hypothetical protein